MNDQNWEKLYQDSLALTKPASGQQLLSPSEISSFHTLIKQAFETFLKTKELHLGLKTYVNHELHNNLGELFKEHPLSNQVSLEAWLEKIFPEDKFGIVLNYIEEYSNEFAEQAATLVKPLLQHAGLPLSGLSFLFFMGNYGFTPFGIHKEASGEEGFLFHLGPGNKQFYTWDKAEYNEIVHNTQVFHNVEEMLPEATCHELKPGDVMFIPHKVYHIANSSEFSLSFVMDYINPPMDQLEIEWAQSVGKQGIQLPKRSYVPPVNMNAEHEELFKLLNRESILRKVEEAFHKQLLRLKSNGGILRPSQKNAQKLIPNDAFSIQGKKAFPVLTHHIGSKKTEVYARGNRSDFTSSTYLDSLLDQLNKGDRLLSGEIIDNKPPNLDMSEIYSLLSFLIETEAVDVTV